MYKSAVEETFHGYQGVKTNMQCLLLNTGLEYTVKILDQELQITVRQNYPNKEELFYKYY